MGRARGCGCQVAVDEVLGLADLMVVAFSSAAVLLGIVWKQIQRRIGVIEGRLDHIEQTVGEMSSLATHSDVQAMGDRLSADLKESLREADHKRDQARHDMHDRDVRLWSAISSIDSRCSRMEGLLSRVRESD